MTTTFDPFREMDRVLSAMRAPSSAGMPLDLYRTQDHFVARIDLPGVDPQTIDIDVEERTLTVRAERRIQTEEDMQWLARERATGTFARQLTLGYGVAADKIEADYADGVLSLRIPVAEEAKPRKIEVNLGAGSRMITGDVTENGEQA